VPCTAEQATALKKCADDQATCVTAAAADKAAKCKCFQVKCGTSCGVLPPAPGTTVSKAIIDGCVTTTGCTEAECTALFSSSSSLVASFSVLAAVVASRLF